jgi:hypothetical protein
VSSDVRPGTTEPIWSPILIDATGARLTGLVDVYVRIVRSDGLFYDFADGTFKAFASAVQVDQLMTQVSAAGAPGLYVASWAPPASGVYLALIHQTGASASNLDATVELRVGQVAFPGDAMDLVTDAVDAAAVAASGVAELQAGLPTAASVVAALLVEPSPEAPVAGSLGETFEVLRGLALYRLETDLVGGGREILYNRDDEPWLTWTLRDSSNGAITNVAGSPARRGAAA